MTHDSLAGINNLAERIFRREIIFFVGSGCSIDSEGNGASRLMMRLVIQFCAMVATLKEQAANAKSKLGKSVRGHKTELEKFPQKLHETFGLDKACFEDFKQDDRVWKNVGKLAINYYEPNDWFCGAFERLLCIAGTSAQSSRERNKLARLMGAHAERLRCVGKTEFDDVPLPPVAPQYMVWAAKTANLTDRNAGKALFLDTVGLADPQIMGGEPRGSGRQLESSYIAKLLPRHWVLARLAREGLCPLVLTTNYDLLLEGAWRCTGFELEQSNAKRTGMLPDRPRVPIPRMARIASAFDFQQEGKAIDTSLVVKVHGCAERYRSIRDELLTPGKNASSLDMSSLEGYMESIVFTYREIQNWRSDSWSRDLLANLQRTKSVAFVGYSLQDPVIHDAFRSVYEEMSTHEPHSPLYEKPPTDDLGRAPAFFFGQADKQSFHAHEMLNAASLAAGVPPTQMHSHENYLGFRFRDRTQPQMGDFPNLDDLFLWAYHRVIRTIQQDCVQHDLRTVVRSLIGRNPFPSEQKEIGRQLTKMVANEHDELKNAPAVSKPGRTRLTLQRITAWTYWFHTRLLREFAMGDWVQSQNGPGYSVNEVRTSEWYFPTTARRDWTAWGLVVELALRNTLANVAVENQTYKGCYPVKADVPTIVFTARLQDLEGASLLRLVVGDYDRVGVSFESDVAVGTEFNWRLDPVFSPWPGSQAHKDTSKRLGSSASLFGQWEYDAPYADRIWDAALGNHEALQDLEAWIGKSSEVPT